MSSASMFQIKAAGIAGAFFVLIGAIFLGCWSKLFDFVLYKQLVLTETSYSNELWEEIPIPVYIDFYFFNWTNSEDFLDENPEIRKPKLTELGPYVFSEVRKKVVLDRKDGKTVVFQQNKTWAFEPSLSKGSLDDLLTTLNVPAVAATYTIRGYDPWVKHILNEAIIAFNSKLNVTKKVGEFLFDGYRDPLLDLAAWVPPGVLPVTIPFDKFGWFYTRNGSEAYDGVFEMFTGKGNISRFGKVYRWNYENPSSHFNSSCGIMNGSAGEFFPPHPKKGESITLFSSDICRVIELEYKEEVTVDGINGYRYWGDEHVFDNVSVRPQNWCFCPGGPCPPHGAIDVSTCKWGTPAYISFPHFLHADPYYRESVHGMKPVESLHQMYIDLEKTTGIPIQVEGSFQINMFVQPFPEYDMFRNVSEVYFPMLWFKERAKIDDKIGKLMRLVSKVPTAGYILFGGFLCLGLAILAVTGTFYYFNFKRQRNSETDLKLVGT